MATLSNITNTQAKNKGLIGIDLLKKKKAADQVYTAPNIVQKPVDLSKPTQNLNVTGTSATSGGNKFILPQNVAPKAPLPAKEAPVDPYSTPEYLQALADKKNKIAQEALVEKGMQDTNKVASTYGLATGPSTIEEAVKAFKDKQAAQKSDLQKQIDEANRVDKLQAGASNAQAESAQAANTATFAQGREGAMSGTTPKLVSEFNTATQKRVNDTNTRLDYAISQREKLMTDLDEAQKSGQQELAASIEKQLSLAQLQIDKVQTDLANATAEATKEAAGFLDKATTAISSGNDGGAIAKMSVPEISALYKVDANTAVALQSYSLQKAQLDQNAPDYQAKVASLNRNLTQAKLDNLDIQTKALDLIGTYQSLGQFDLADNVARDAGLMDNPVYTQQKEQIGQALKYQEQTFKSSGAYIPAKGVYKVIPNGKGGIEIDTPVGQCPANGRGQCGEFSNDFYGLPPDKRIFGNSYASKADNINSDVPVVGGAFIMKTSGESAPYGHVGIITQVYKINPNLPATRDNIKGFDFKDSNRHNNETIDTGHFDGNNFLSGGFTGFFDPKKPSPGWEPPSSMQPGIDADAETLMGHFPLLYSSKASEVDTLLVDDWAKQVSNGASLNDIKAQIDASSVPKAKQAGYVANILQQVASKASGMTKEVNLDTPEMKKQRAKLASSNEAKAINAFNDLEGAINTYKSLVDKAGAVAWNEENQASITNAYANLKVKWKEAANLGALTGPDLGLIEDAIPNITGKVAFLNKLRSGDAKQNILDAIDLELSRVSRERENRANTLKNIFPDFEGTDLLEGIIGGGTQSSTNGYNPNSLLDELSSSSSQASFLDLLNKAK